MNAAVDVFKRNEFQGSSLDALNAWVAEVAALTQPDHIYWCDGSDAEYDALLARMLDDGTLLALN